MTDASLGKKLLELGWRAGSVVPDKLLGKLRPHLRHANRDAPSNIDSNDWLIVVSQSCDIVASKEETEPFVELLWARPQGGKPRSQFCDLRSSRRLDFRPNRDVLPNVVLSAHASTDRFVVPRSVLAESSPDDRRTLTKTAIRRLHAWLALRCNRPAWPETFVQRLSPAKKHLKDALELVADEIAEVRVGILPNDQELGTKMYDVAVYFVVPAEQFQSSRVVRLAQQAFAQFVAALESCDGIRVNAGLSDVVSGDDFTWEQVQRTDLWDFAYLSPFE